MFMENLKIKIVSLLRWSERYTKTDMLYLAKGGSWLFIGQVVSTLSVFITSIAFANLLPPDVYGIYKYVLSITSILAITTLTGMDSAVTQAVARGYDGSLSQAFRTKLKWGTLGTVASLFIALYYYTQGNLVLALSFCIVAIFTPFNESFDLYNSFLFGKKDFGTQAKYGVLSKILIVSSIVTTLFLTNNIWIILSVYFMSLFLPSAFFLIKTLRKQKENNNIDKDTVSYGKHLSLIGIIGLIAMELDKILIFQNIGATELAIFVLAVAPVDQLKGIMKNLNSLALPKLANQKGEDIKKSINHKILILALITGGIVLVYILLAPIFFKLFFPKYLSSVIYSQILSISLIGAVISSFLYTVLESQKAKEQLYKFNIYGNLFTIILLFPLVLAFGIWGAISARIISRYILATISYKLVKK